MAAIPADDISKCILLNENYRIPTEICSWESNWQWANIGSGNG